MHHAQDGTQLASLVKGIDSKASQFGQVVGVINLAILLPI